MSVSFLWNKENKNDFFNGDKKSKFLPFSLVYFLSFCFFCSFLIPFTEHLITFIKLIFNSMLLLIVNCFGTLVSFGKILMFVLEVVCYDSNILLILFVPDYLLMRSVITGLLLVFDRRVLW